MTDTSPAHRKSAPAPRPKDAATVIIWRSGPDGFEVLMGERHKAHRFMPQRYVFPGGRVDPHDARVRSATDPTPIVATQLSRTTTPGRARSIAVAAVRETFEEAGLIIGAPDPMKHRPAPRGWEGFFRSGFAPALHHLQYIARAVTPPVRPIRFDARFFMVPASEVLGDVRGSGELQNLDWIPIRKTGKYELAMVTRRVLEYAEQLLQEPLKPSPEQKIPYFKPSPDGGHVLIHQ